MRSRNFLSFSPAVGESRQIESQAAAQRARQERASEPMRSELRTPKLQEPLQRQVVAAVDYFQARFDGF